MKTNLGQSPQQYQQGFFSRVLRDIEEMFSRINPDEWLAVSATLNFSAPGTVPGYTDQVVAVDGVELGDSVLVGAPIGTPAGFLPPQAFVSAADQVTVRWAQLTGAAADPDGAGGTYRLDIRRH